MQLSFHRGRLFENPLAGGLEFGPNLDIIPKVSAAYEESAKDDPPNADHILQAHRNFLRTAIYFLYEYNRVADAAYWYKYLCEKYPDKPLLDGRGNSIPRNLTLAEYVLAQIGMDINETSHDKVTAAIEGMLRNAYESLVFGQEDRYAGYQAMAQRTWEIYQSKMGKESLERVGLSPLADIDRDVRARFLDPQGGVPWEARAILRTKLGLPPEAAAPAATTNAPPAKVSSQ